MTHRLLHLADVHLDRSFAGLGCQGDLARRRRQGLRDALRAAGDAARQHGCDAVTIAGDLYEHERAGIDTERFLVATFQSWQPMTVLLAPGNHDALLPGSLYRRAPWPENVHVFAEPHLEPFEMAEGLVIWGLAHREPAWRGNPLAGASAPADSRTHVALFHGSELGSLPDGKPAHGPFHAAEIRSAGFDAALCGHFHRRRVDADAGLVYPGSPEPLGFDEAGARGPVLVEVGAAGTLTFSPLSLNRWWMVSAACQLEGAGSGADVLDAVVYAARAALRDVDPERAMVRVDLDGPVDSSVPLDVLSLESAARDRCGAAHLRVRDATVPALDLAAIAAEQSARGAFVRAAQDAIDAAGDPSDAARAADALRYGLMALSGVEVGLR